MTPISPLAPAARFRAPSPMTMTCPTPQDQSQTLGRHLGHRPAIRLEGRF